ncbi:hypothetical protein HMPREF0101_02911 [Bacteroides fragilis]|nr:hypothetical protein HMPREF0101_02911 [Bacteroides fragilis]
MFSVNDPSPPQGERGLYNLRSAPAKVRTFIMPSCQGKFHPFGTSVRRVTHPAAYELCNSGTTSCTTRHAPVAQLVFPAFPSTRIYLPDKDKVTFRKVFTDKSLSLQSQL